MNFLIDYLGGGKILAPKRSESTCYQITGSLLPRPRFSSCVDNHAACSLFPSIFLVWFCNLAPTQPLLE